ncbi:NAD(P)-binding domain-containing protein [Frankia gtarii]|uniref:NAD(P)-binding domain-containing protein n=1 Tax=Frankia gtarii TaxID=2950102 RepID=UPI0021BF6A55|nr:NAD(P)-binding domain-containing protein [Frankia gtarii]
MSGEYGLSPVTVIGLGPMGRTMAATLMRSGHPVTVWNRTPGRPRRPGRRGRHADAHADSRRCRQRADHPQPH